MMYRQQQRTNKMTIENLIKENTEILLTINLLNKHAWQSKDAAKTIKELQIKVIKNSEKIDKLSVQSTPFYSQH